MSRSYLSYLSRVKKAPAYYFHGLIEEFGDKDVFLFAQAIAFKVLVSIVPVIVLIAGIGIWIYGDNLLQELQDILPQFLPAYESEQILRFLDQLIRTSTQWTPVAAAGFLMTGVFLFTTVRLAVKNAFEQHWNEDRTMIRGYLFDLRMVLQVGLFFLLTIGLTIIAQMIHSEAIDLFRWLGIDIIQEGWQLTFNLISVLLPLLITTAMFFQLYYFIPKPHPPIWSAIIGAAVAAVLWEVAKYGFTLYATYVAAFDRFGEGGPTAVTGEGMTALANSFGLILAFVFWVYYSGVVLLLGALIASLNERHRRTRKEETKIAKTRSMPKLEAAARERPVLQNDEPTSSPNTSTPRSTSETV